MLAKISLMILTKIALMYAAIVVVGADECYSTPEPESIMTVRVNTDDLFTHIYSYCPSLTPNLVIIGLDRPNITINFDTIPMDPPVQTLKLFLFGNVFLSVSQTQNLNKDLKSLEIMQSQSLKLPVLGSFASFTNLENLNLSDNGISQLPLDIFFSSIQIFNFANNSITSLPPLPREIRSLKEVNMSGNPIDCGNCRNAHNYLPKIYQGVSCQFPAPCSEAMDISAKKEDPGNEDLVAYQTRFSCLATSPTSSTKDMAFAWVSKLGILASTAWINGDTSSNSEYSLSLRPVLAKSKFFMDWLRFDKNATSSLTISYLRGSFSSDWFCLGVSKSGGLYMSKEPIRLQVDSTFPVVFNICLTIGFVFMFVLLLIGIIGGTIRYLIETNCCTKRQPHYNYAGRKFVGVIPVPLYEDGDGDYFHFAAAANNSARQPTVVEVNVTQMPVPECEAEPFLSQPSPVVMDDVAPATTSSNASCINADVKISIVDDLLVTTYCETLEQLQKARIHPSYDFFYERLESFRNRVKQDVMSKHIKITLHQGSSEAKVAEAEPLRSGGNSSNGLATISINNNNNNFGEEFDATGMVSRVKMSISQVREQFQSITDLCSSAISIPSHSRLLFGQTIHIYQSKINAPANGAGAMANINANNNSQDSNNLSINSPISEEIKITEFYF